VKIYKNSLFIRFARGQRITDKDLCEAIKRAKRGLIDADLGGGVIKQRIARPNEGRSGGSRTIVLFRAEERAFFVYGFSKNQRDNINEDELAAFKLVAKEILNYTLEQIVTAIEMGRFNEVNCDEEDLQK